MGTQITISPKEFQLLVKVISDTTKKRIVHALLGHSETHPMYFNEIFKTIGGSKTTVANALFELTSDGILEPEWKILDTGAKVNPERAVKVFKIKDEHLTLFERCKVLLEEGSEE